ncbi:MAG TPA: ComF family protein [Candidatus Binataceae bacterium]|nr:ComF family protein [Candidatus Binataceae bacterium]
MAAAFQELVNFLYPPRCAACDAPFDISTDYRVCGDCLARVEPVPGPHCEICGGPLESVMNEERLCARCIAEPPSFRRAVAIARYRSRAEDEPGTLPALLRRHKYGLDQAVGRALAEYLGDELPIHPQDYDVVVPIPLHRRRLWWRGFNQSALLASEIAARLALPLDVSVVMRTRFTPPQTARDHDAGKRNVRRAFMVARPARIASKRILLVDDVMTTGATVDECSRAMLAAGAACVDVFTLARVL